MSRFDKSFPFPLGFLPFVLILTSLLALIIVLDIPHHLTKPPFASMINWCRKPKSSVVPSVLVRNAPESCDVFVVSRRGVIKNKPKTLLATGITEIHSISQMFRFGCFHVSHCFFVCPFSEDSAKEFLVSKSEHHSLTVSKQLPWNSSSSTNSRTNKNSQLSSTSGFSGPDSHIQAYPVYSTTFLQQIHLADNTLDFETVQSRSSRPSTPSEQVKE